MPEAPRSWTRKIYTYLSTQNLEEKPAAIVSGQGESSRRSAAGSEARSKRVLELEHWASTRLQQWASSTGSKRKRKREREREISRYWETNRDSVDRLWTRERPPGLRPRVASRSAAWWLLFRLCLLLLLPSGDSQRERERGLLLRDSRDPKGVLDNNGPAWPGSGWREADDG